MREKLFEEIKWVWDNSYGNVEDFIMYLLSENWKPMKRDSFKLVYTKNNLVIKFDGYDLEDDKNTGLDGRYTHTAHEHRCFLWSRKKERGKYICPSLFYYNGILVQPKLKNIASYGQTQPEFEELGKRLRFSHYWHYGFLDGKVKWFDVDSMGSGWYNWRGNGRYD